MLILCHLCSARFVGVVVGGANVGCCCLCRDSVEPTDNDQGCDDDDKKDDHGAADDAA